MRGHFILLSLLISPKRLIDWIVAPDGRFGVDPLAERDDLLSKSLSQAVSNLSTRLGPDMNKWRYGQENYRHVLIRHPLSPAVNAEARELPVTDKSGGSPYI